jgi:1-acyl-sn-glycerol-3-phosphate acyltransferase
LRRPNLIPVIKKYYLADTPQRRALVALARSLFQPVMDMRVEGPENWPSEGPAVLVANHVTNFDVFPIQFALPRPIFFMGKAELFKNPLMDLVLCDLSGFPVNRGENDQWAMRTLQKSLRMDKCLACFPRGHARKAKG